MPWSILIVDDSATSRAPIRTHLLAKGAQVIEAESGKEGLWRARTQKIDLILTDIHMPVMDGLQMIRELRQLHAHSTTPIFVATSDASGQRAAEAKAAGANGWLVKPADPSLVWMVVENSLRAVPQSPQSATDSENYRVKGPQK